MPIYSRLECSPCEGVLARPFRKTAKSGLALRAHGRAIALGFSCAALFASQTAQAHGIAGNRLFPETLTFDDPAVSDEAVLPNFSSLDHCDGRGNVTDNRINWTFTRLLTPTVGVVIDNSWIARNWGVTQRFGFDVTSVGLKWEVYRNNTHEALVAASLLWGTFVAPEPLCSKRDCTG
jgi:hypothetical protein